MATVMLAVTDEAQDMVSALSLEDGTRYTVQNVGGRNVRLFEGTEAERNAADGGHTLRHAGRGSYIVEPESAGPVWVWCAPNRRSILAVTESPD